MYQQLHEHFNSILSPKQCVFRKGCSAQHCLMVNGQKNSKNRGTKEKNLGPFSSISKAFDCRGHNLLITKPSWYGVTTKLLKLSFSYLSNRTQGIRMNNSHSRKSGIKCCVPQGSVLGPLLFYIDLIDLFLKFEDDNSTSYADETTP